MNKQVCFFVIDITLKGGVERFVSNLARSLSGDGFNVAIYSFHKTYDKPLYVFPENVEIIYLSNISFRPFLYKFVTFWSCAKLRQSLKSYRNKFVAISTHPITTIFLYFLYRDVLGRTIASEHSTYLAHNKAIRLLRLVAYKHVRNVVTQTEDGVKRFALGGLAATRIANPTTIFNDTRQWPNEVAVGSRDTFTCLSIARFEQVKQLHHYIETARLVHEIEPQIQFVLVGSGPLESYLKELISTHSLSEVFSIFPPTPQVNCYYASSDAYIITSSSEAFPMTVLEALSFAVPVISYDRLVGPAEIIIDNSNGYLCDQDCPDAIARRILGLYYDRDLLTIMRRNALESSLQFRPENISKEWAKLL